MVKEFIGDKLQLIEEQTLLTFMDELTALARRYNLVITSEDPDGMTPTIRKAPFEDVHQGRYIMAVHPDQRCDNSIEGPVEIMFMPSADLSNELIDIDNI